MLDPRTRLVLALMYGALVVFTRGWTGLAAEGALLLMVVTAGRLWGSFLRWLVMLMPMAIFFALVMAWSFGPREGTEAGLRLLVLATVFFVFFSTTPPEDLGNALVQSGLPFSVAFVMTASLQFVPIVTAKARAVMDAQRSRGLSLSPGWAALRQYPLFLLPILVQVFQLAEELAEAMEARGFGRSPRSSLYRFRFTALDWAVLAGAAGTAALGWWWIRG
ncbi:MAG: energy-coupling factor transporter transmembrane component T family protein [Desulfobacterales bacterium]